MTLSLAPVYLIDIMGCVAMLVLSLLCLRQVLRLYRRDRQDALAAYLLWLIITLTGFCLFRSVGHLVKYWLLFTGHEYTWTLLSPLSGGLITITFIAIFSVTLFFNTMLAIMNRMHEDRRKIRQTSTQILELNRDIESMVAERTRAEFGLQLAHEIRNPVMVIAGLLKRMSCEPDNREQNRRYRESIIRESRKLEDLVSRFEKLHGRDRGPFGLIVLNDLLDDSVQMIADEAEGKGIDLVWSRPASPMTCQGDGRYLRVAIHHLLRNAVEACSRGDTVSLRLEPAEGGSAIVIEDTGPGIPAEARDHIFEPFYSTKQGSSGLGLPYVRQIINEHRGRIEIDSTPDSGCRVAVFLPGRLEGFSSGRNG